MIELIHDDCRLALDRLAPASIDAVVCDPPYEIELMGQSWDKDSGAFDASTWEKVKRVSKPGAWVTAFGGRRTWHRLVCAMEDAGLTITDTLAWFYTTGNVTAKETRLKPAWEPIVLAQVPSKQSLAKTVAEHGTGHLEIDASRIPYLDAADLERTQKKNPGRNETFTSGVYGTDRPQQRVNAEGRHPSNVLVDDAVAELLGEDRRFFVCPKASKRERDAGLAIERGIARNPHTCVKPIELLEWLVGLVVPASGTVLDHYMGSGSTGIAAARLGNSFIGIEREEIYHETAQLRIDHARRELETANR
jgi:DNA modification methylase